MSIKKSFKFLGPILFLVLPQIVFASTSRPTLAATMGITSNTYKTSSTNYESSTYVTLAPGYIFGDGTKLTASISASQDWQEKNGLEKEDGSLSLSRKIVDLSKVFAISGAGAVLIPMSEKSSDFHKLRTATTLSSTLNANLSEANLTGLSVSLTPSYTRYFYKYNRTKSGKSLTRDKVGLTLATSYDLFESISLFISGGFTNKWNHNGSATEGYSLAEGVNIALFNMASLSLVHSTGDDLFGHFGKDAQFKIADRDTSTLSAIFTLSI